MEEGGRAMAPSGSYLLIVVSQPLTEGHKEVILDRLNKGLLSWDVEATGCDLNGLEAVCSNITSEQLQDTDVLIQHSTERLGVEVLVSPTVSTLRQCLKNLLSTSAARKHLVHAGYAFKGSGSWILSNGSFSFDELRDLFQHADVVRVQRDCRVEVHCTEVGRWTQGAFAKLVNASLNPPQKVDTVPGAQHLINCLRNVLSSQALEEIMEASPLVGNLRFNRPSLYMFPAGQGDCALFGVNGFNMLIDGGFSRKPCSWDFIRHLDRLDAVLVTRLSENNLCGMSTLMKRKAINNTYPQIGYVFCNVTDGKKREDQVEDSKDELVVSVVDEGHAFVQTLNDLKLKPHQCWRDSSIEPFVLYHKVGFGTLEMHVLSPPKDSKEMKDFLSEWSSYKETFSFVQSGLKSKSLEAAIPLSHSTSICAILVWRPADPQDKITRIMFPGSAPQSKIFESLVKLKNLEILNHPTVSKASLASKLVAKTKSSKLEVKASIPNRKNAASPAHSVSSVASRNGDIASVKKEVKKIVKRETNHLEAKKEIKRDRSKEVKRDAVVKDTKDGVMKNEGKRDRSKEVKRDNAVKGSKENLVKKETKDIRKAVKPVSEKKVEVKTLAKKTESATTAASKITLESKKTNVIKKSLFKKEKDVSKPNNLAKASDKPEIKKTLAAKSADLKSVKDVKNKKTVETKTTAKTKPKSTTSAAKAASKADKGAKTNAVSKPTAKITGAVAASSVVGAAVAVTAAAIELNEKKEDIEEVIKKKAEIDIQAEPEINIEKTEVGQESGIDIEKQSDVNVEIEAQPIVDESKLTEDNELPEEMVVSPLPPEALSPEPSESVSITASDTLSSAPLETVSPTPPLQNEPLSIEEKEVNEVKSIDQDLMPDEREMLTDDDDNKEEAWKQIEAVGDQEAGRNLMTTSFMGDKNFENAVNETEIMTNVSALNQEQAVTQHQESEYQQEIEEPVAVKSARSTDFFSENRFDDVIETSVDDPLAGATMEGSFCSGMMPTRDDQEQQLSEFNIQKTEIETSYASEQNYMNVNTDSKEFEDEEVDSDSVVRQGYAIREEHSAAFHSDNYEQLETLKSEATNELFSGATSTAEEILTEANNGVQDVGKETLDTEIVEDMDFIAESNVDQSNECLGEIVTQKKFEEEKENEIIDDYNIKSNEIVQVQDNEDVIDKQKGSDSHGETHIPAFQQFEDNSDITAMQTSVHEYKDEAVIDSNENKVIDDADEIDHFDEKQEEIVRKESVVSITLNNDEEPGEYEYGDQYLRRKSGTESEDDVDLQRYLVKEPVDPIDPDKLSINKMNDSDSDDEDVVKSPTPHAIVDYEGQLDDISGQAQQYGTQEHTKDYESDIYMSKKNQDYDEKDRDSAEEEDEEEMIRHPTPPGEIKYSEEEMRDPIMPHFITTPHQASDITEQPLYEEPEDSSSERSQSPIVEQPVFGSVIEADFPELVTVSGGTTPSEPQSPKSAFELKKFNSDAALGVMEALSEHDCSESSTHSPLCHDGGTAFEIPEQASSEHHGEMASNLAAYDSKSDSGDIEVPCDDNVHCEINPNEQLEESKQLQCEQEEYNVQYKETTNIGQDVKSIVDDFPYDHGQIEASELPDININDVSHGVEAEHSVTLQETRFDQYIYEKSKLECDSKSDTREDADSDIQADYQDNRSDIHDSRSDIHEDVTAEIQDNKSDIHDSRSDIHEEVIAEIHADGGFDNSSFKSDIPADLLADQLNMQENFSTHEEHMDLQAENISHDYNLYGHEVPEPFVKQEISSPTSLNYDDETAADGVSHQMIENVYEKTASEYQTSSISNFSQDNAQENVEICYSGQLNDQFYGQGKLQEDIGFSNSGFDKNIPASLDAYGTELKAELQQETTLESQNSSYLETNSQGYVSTTAQIVAEPEYLIEGFEHEGHSFKEIVDTTSSEISTSGVDVDIACKSKAIYSDEHIADERDLVDAAYSEKQTSRDSQFSAYEEYSKDEANSFRQDFSEVHGANSLEKETYSHTQLAPESGMERIRTNGFGNEQHESDFSDNLTKQAFQTESKPSMINGKDQSWYESTEYRQETFGSNPAYPESYTTNNLAKIEQEASYIIDSRFHSDSPEDNVMRNDSSPDAPLDPATKFPELKSAGSFLNEDFTNNINCPGSGLIPTSPNNKARNVNRENPYGESSEDEDSSSLPGTVSPYAYTNKAYTQEEEEDVDGNHIYKESPTSDVIKQLEYDGNNPPAVETHRTSYTSGFSETHTAAGNTNYDFRLEEWGKPMGLPTPPDATQKTVATKKTSKTLSKPTLDNGKSPTATSKVLTASPLKKAKPKTTKEASGSFSPVYVDLAYVPHHGDPQYCDVEFFNKIRARYYVFSGINPSKEVLNALLEAKKSWNEDLEVTIIPTYETDTLGYWVAQNQDDLALYSIEVAPSASRCTVNLQDHETRCAAYRLEF